MNQTWIMIALGGIAALALFAAVTAHRRLTLQRRSLVMLQSGHTGETLLDASARHIAAVKDLSTSVDALYAGLENIGSQIAVSNRRLGLVRYDAFEDMGGRMSFSAAFLDDTGCGMVLTSINGRTETRVYAKEIVEGTSQIDLSREEQRAIAQAIR